MGISMEICCTKIQAKCSPRIRTEKKVSPRVQRSILLSGRNSKSVAVLVGADGRALRSALHEINLRTLSCCWTIGLTKKGLSHLSFDEIC